MIHQQHFVKAQLFTERLLLSLDQCLLCFGGLVYLAVLLCLKPCCLETLKLMPLVQTVSVCSGSLQIMLPSTAVHLRLCGETLVWLSLTGNHAPMDFLHQSKSSRMEMNVELCPGDINKKMFVFVYRFSTKSWLSQTCQVCQKNMIFGVKCKHCR